MNILLVNTGSSSLKIAVYCDRDMCCVGTAAVDWSVTPAHYRAAFGTNKKHRDTVSRDASSALEEILQELSATRIDAVAHRVVHGGELSESVLITEPLMQSLEKLSHLAPLHNPPCINAIQLARSKLPHIPHIAVFDTAFHRTMPPIAAEYAIPSIWADEWGIKRYGFHGLSHAYCARRACELLARPIDNVGTIICHLGHGCSVCAVREGKSLDTTMGFTPLEGLMMATRSGSVDPAIISHLEEHYGIPAQEAVGALNSKAGLLGVSGVSADMREICTAAAQGNSRAQLAIDMFCYKVAQAISQLSVPLAGADALVFSGGIGENSPYIRAKICQLVSFLGFSLDAKKNERNGIDTDVATAESLRRIFVIESREDLSMLHEATNVLSAQVD